MSKLISEAYRKLNYDLHKSNPAYGKKGEQRAAAIAEVLRHNGVQTVLDYGCGKGTLKPALKKRLPQLIVREYDPAVPGKRDEPKPSEVVVCLDVMEHIEPECLDAVLDHVRTLTTRFAIMTIAVQPAKKTLADGRNAHLIVEPKEWWQEKLARCFRIEVVEQPSEHWFQVILKRLQD